MGGHDLTGRAIEYRKLPCAPISEQSEFAQRHVASYQFPYGTHFARESSEDIFPWHSNPETAPILGHWRPEGGRRPEPKCKQNGYRTQDYCYDSFRFAHGAVESQRMPWVRINSKMRVPGWTIKLTGPSMSDPIVVRLVDCIAFYSFAQR